MPAIDIRHVYNLGPSKFRTGAPNNKEQTCYFNYSKKDRAYNNLTVLTVNIYYKLGDKLRKFDNERGQPNQEFENLVKQTLATKRQW